MYPTVTDRDVLGIPFLAPPSEVSDHVRKLVRSGLEMIEKGQQQLGEAVALMSEHIQEPDAALRGISDKSPRVQQERKSYRVKKRKR
jgi:hypothetical protein